MEQVRPWKLYLARGFLNLGVDVGLMRVGFSGDERAPIAELAAQLVLTTCSRRGNRDSSAARRSLARAISCAMIWLTWCWMFSVVTRMALAMARSRAEPWAFITAPLKPSSGAPPKPSGSMRRLMVRNAFWASKAPSWRRGLAVSSRLQHRKHGQGQALARLQARCCRRTRRKRPHPRGCGTGHGLRRCR